jgi:predicted NBD/HSP70 family sugar kinase
LQNDFQHFVGIDWGSVKHRVCVMDGAGKIIEERWVEHNGHTLMELVDWLRRQT